MSPRTTLLTAALLSLFGLIVPTRIASISRTAREDCAMDFAGEGNIIGERGLGLPNG